MHACILYETLCLTPWLPRPTVLTLMKHAGIAFELGEHLVAPLYEQVARLFPLRQGKHGRPCRVGRVWRMFGVG